MTLEVLQSAQEMHQQSHINDNAAGTRRMGLDMGGMQEAWDLPCRPAYVQENPCRLIDFPSFPLPFLHLCALLLTGIMEINLIALAGCGKIVVEGRCLMCFQPAMRRSLLQRQLMLADARTLATFLMDPLLTQGFL